jgi:L-rhamnose isomerase / sugar isomerase
MIGQSFNIEPKIEAMILSVPNCQGTYAKALLVDRPALVAAQQAGDVLGAHEIQMAAFRTDVRPLLAGCRRRRNLPPDPPATWRACGAAEEHARRRGTASAASGYGS